jgi:hypothetical protein
MRRQRGRFRAGAIRAGGALAVAVVVGCTPAGPGAPRGTSGPWLITTLVGGPGERATVSSSPVPCAMAATASSLYLAGGGLNWPYTVTRVAEATGTLTYVAGYGSPGGSLTPDGLPALTAQVPNPCGLAVDAHGNLVVVQGDASGDGKYSPSVSGSPEIRVVAARDGTWYGQLMRAGRIYTIAGTGSRGLAGDGGPAARATLRHPGAVAVDRHGNVIFADVGNARIRVVAERSGTFYGVPMRAGDIYTVAGTGPVPVDPGYPLGPPVAAGAAALRTVLDLEVESALSPGFPAALAVDRRGDIVFADTAGTGVKPGTGLLLLAARTGQAFGRPVTAGHLYPLADLGAVVSVAVDPAGNVLAARAAGPPVVVAAATGTWYGRAMTPGRVYPLPVAPGAPGHRVAQVAVDPAGNLFEAFEARLATASQAGTDLVSGQVWVLARHSGTLYGKRVRAEGFALLAGLSASSATAGRMGLPVVGFTGAPGGARGSDLSGLPAGWAWRFVPPTLALDRIVITAPGSGTWFGQPMLSGHAYTIAGDGRTWLFQHVDGAIATAVPLPMIDPVPVSDRSGNVLIADPFGGKVWAVATRSGVFYGRPMAAGHIYTIVVGPDVRNNPGIRFATCHDWLGPLVTDTAGNLVMGCGRDGLVVLATGAGPDYGLVMRPGRLYPLSGRLYPLVRSEGIYPAALVVDHFGNLVVANQPTHNRGTINVIAGATGLMYGQQMTAGVAYQIAPIGRITIQAMAADPWGNLLAATADPRPAIDVIAGQSGTFYGIPMVAGRTYVIAGSGPLGYAGDGGPAALARFLNLQAIAFWPGHGILVDDAGRVRLIYPPAGRR